MSLAADFEAQARACAALGSPFTAGLLRCLGAGIRAGNPLADRLLTWPGDRTALGDAVPLRLAGGLHALVLTGQDPSLAAFYTLHAPIPWPVLAAALDRHQDFLMHFIDSAPQTNEVRRSAVLIAAGHWLTARFGLPMVLSELGASAGLNLLWDRYALVAAGQVHGPEDAVLTLAPVWDGPALPDARPHIASRASVDLNPLDPVADRVRLMAYLWADQTERLERTEIALSEAARLRPKIARGDAGDWLETRLATPHPGQLHLVFHTVAWQYFPAATQAMGRALLEKAGADATPDAPLAHLAMEADGTPNDGAALTLRLWPQGETLALGRADFHGRWVRWRVPPLR